MLSHNIVTLYIYIRGLTVPQEHLTLTEIMLACVYVISIL